MKRFSILSILIGFIVASACQHSSTNSKTTFQVPELLMRPNIIGPENEMGYMVDQYNTLMANLKSNPEDHESRLGLAELFMMEARISGEHGYYYPAALQLLDNVLQHDLKTHVAYRAKVDKASVLLSLHQFDEAKMIGEEALKTNPHSADIYGVLVDANVELGNYSEAIAYADKMVSIRPDLRSYSRISYLREIHGMVDESIEAMKMAVAAGYPGMEQTEWARLTLGHLYSRYGMIDSAMVQYALALEARPQYPFAIAALADAYEVKGEAIKADSLSNIAMHLIPEISFFVSRAISEKDKGNTAVSEKLSREILDMLAEDEAAGHSMDMEKAHIYLDLLDKPADALKFALVGYHERPENIDVNKQMAEIYYALHEVDKAEEHLVKAMSTGTKDPELKCLEGLILTKKVNAEAGKQHLKALFVENPYLQCRICDEARAIVL